MPRLPAGRIFPTYRRLVLREREDGRPSAVRTWDGLSHDRAIARHELVEETALALEEALGVEGVGQPQVRVIEVVADLVEQRAQERLECDHALVGDGPHPDADARRPPILARVE